jgi:uncharacterized protein YbjQ (UPF0145 family)
VLEFLFDYGIFLGLLALGFVSGRYLEKRHYRRLIQREAESDVMIFPGANIPQGLGLNTQQLVVGSVVISNDYFKAFLSSLRKIFGGNIGAYESLLDRARREAVLRMKSEARALDADTVINVKLETTSISKGKSLVTVEVLAYGTAIQ